MTAFLAKDTAYQSVRPGSILELLHPNGCVDNACVLGSACPPALAPESDESSAYDLILVAPTSQECQSRDWLASAGVFIGAHLTADGLVYLLPPPHQSETLAQCLASPGLEIELSILHHPDWQSTRYLIPLESGPIRYAFGTLVSAPLWRRLGARLALATCAGRKQLSRSLPRVVLVARRPGARRVCDRLLQLTRSGNHNRTWLLSTSWRGAAGGAIIAFLFENKDARPTSVVKIAATASQEARLMREASNLQELGYGAARAGVTVPEVISYKNVAGRVMLVEAMLNGKSLSTLVSQKPSQALGYIQEVAGWLERWNQASRNVRPLEREDLESFLLQPARSVLDELQGGDRYLKHLEQRCAQVKGLHLPFVAAHNDLTLANILRDSTGRLGIVDWEAANSMHFPLVDLLYIYVDAVTALPGVGGRFCAFQACFQPSGSHFTDLHEQIRRSIKAIGLPNEFFDLCVHACWLHHAANEARTHNAGPRPFLQIAQWLASHCKEIVVSRAQGMTD